MSGPALGKFDPDNNEALAGEPRLPYFTLEQVLPLG
jgi:hypothetical protein